MLKMTLQRFVSRFALLTLLLCTGCHPSVVIDNSALVDNVQPGNVPWMVYLQLFPPQLQCVGALITDQWVLTEMYCINSFNINDTKAILGIQNHTGDNPNAVNRMLVDVVCKNDSGMCLVKLSSPVNFSDDIQAIPLASNMSTFDYNTAAWGSVIELQGEVELMINSIKEIEVSILNNDECIFQVVSETVMCVKPTDACLLFPGSAVFSNVRSQWVLLGVNMHGFYRWEYPLTFTRVSFYEQWIREVITGMQPTFVTVSSSATNPDENSGSSGESTTTSMTTITTIAPNTTTIVDPTGMETRSFDTPATVMTAFIPTTPDRSVFSGGDTIHVTHVFSLSVLVLFLHVFVGGWEM